MWRVRSVLILLGTLAVIALAWAILGQTPAKKTVIHYGGDHAGTWAEIFLPAGQRTRVDIVRSGKTPEQLVVAFETWDEGYQVWRYRFANGNQAPEKVYFFEQIGTRTVPLGAWQRPAANFHPGIQWIGPKESR